MEQRDIIKRAFEIASECGSMTEVRRRLIDEGYLQVNAHLAGSQIKREIKSRLNPGMKQSGPD